MNFQIILMFVGMVLAVVGTIMIYDARILTKKLFSFGDQNEASWGLKIVGFIVAMIGCFMIFFLL